ncbi:homeodomain transcription factor [Mycena metata]|uniref:Homeodomain transcription factor n=1 Tax=Mycena metata TaxID=1033252 RepID=A0AAD7NEL0_9AGAR|nr:homeodomain transcription factor [Mycena metata]
MPPLKSSLDKVKKPRHRHSAVQLAALNSLYEETEHPTLGQRTALAQSLGLETKSVNAYFQNKRASSKKQPRGSPYDAPGRTPSNRTLPYSTIDDDYYYPPPEAAARSVRSQPPHDQHPRPRNQLADHSQFLSHPAELRPSRPQIDELQRIYRINPYPTVEELSVVAERIGMRHQAIVEWFRTQRSLDRRRVDVYPTTSAASPAISEERPTERHSRVVYPILPPISTLPPVSAHPSLAGLDSARRLSAITSSEDQPYVPAAPSRMLRRSSSPHRHHNASPYGSSITRPNTSTSASTSSGASTSASSTNGSTAALSARQRRGRPDPAQLTSLRRLLRKTPTPSIEERAALALEIGMDVGKVTNWFRNLRQSTRKRGKSLEGRGSPADDNDDEEDFGYGESSGNSNGTNDSEPVYLSSNRTSRSPSVERGYPHLHPHPHPPHSHSHSSEEEQEAVTPSPSTSPSPLASPAHRGHRPLDLAHLVHPEDKPIGGGYVTQTHTQFSSGRPGVAYEDALLLLTFHRRAGMV